MTDPIIVRCRENGPYLIHGPAKIVDHEGKEFTIPPGKDSIALCRCGHSSRKPFCDGTHRQIGFQAAQTAAAPPT
jgi:CDGSH-type Zn-finger protein